MPSLQCIEARIGARIEARIEGLLDSRKRLTNRFQNNIIYNENPAFTYSSISS